MVTFVIQNILTLRNDRLAPAPLYDSLKQTLASGNYQEAWEICNANKNYLANTSRPVWNASAGARTCSMTPSPNMACARRKSSARGTATYRSSESFLP